MRILLGGIDAHDHEVLDTLPDAVMVVHAQTSDDLLEGVFTLSPDLLIVSREMPDFFETLQRVGMALPVPVVVVARRESPIAMPLSATDIFGYLVRPLDAVTMRQTMTVARVQFQRLQVAQADALQLREAFASRKIIDRAKGILMQRLRLSEGEAYTYLREESRRQRIPIVEIARTMLGEGDGIPGKTLHPAVSASARNVPTPGTRTLRD